ncbi:MAG: ABC transporter substrate-binding protein [Planctomycetota bacterium]|nr:ABC transporter substrate-binding protein [Planctomycetota bacterium]
MAAKKKASKKKAAKKKAAKQKAAPKKAAKKKAAAKAAPATDAPSDKVAEAVMAALAEAMGEEDAEPVRERKPIPKMPARKKGGPIRLALGAEPDAAFMVYALAAGKVETEGREYELIRKDQHVLDDEALKGDYDVTMLSLGAYPRVDDRYMLLPCGGSFGDHRGPILVARSPIRSHEVDGLQVAAPGSFSTAAIALQLWLPAGKFDIVPVPAKHVSLLVRAERARSGLLVTEEQLTYRNHNLVAVVDFGQWWGEETEGLPLPLTVSGIRRDIDEEERAKIALDLKRSIAYALGHREEALEHAVEFARKAPPEVVDKFVDRYVNDLSLDCGERGRQAIQLIFDRAFDKGMLEEDVWPEYHGRED